MKRLALLLLGIPATLPAQSTTLSSFVASDAGVDGAPVLVGVTVAREAHRLGIRWSSAVDARSALSGSDRSSADGLAGLVTAEIDALLYPTGTRSSLPTTPYALVGAGIRVTRDDLSTSLGTLWSYGAGLRTPVTTRLSLEGEGRYRQPIARDAESMPARTAPGWEFRVGVNLRLGRGVPRPVPLPGPAVPIPSRLPAPTDAWEADAAAARRVVALRAIDHADDYLGVRYTWGGNSPDEGFDCSGFIRYVFHRQGIELPRVSRDQARAGTPLPLDPSYFEPGDVLAFASNGSVVDHTAIYAGGGRIIHSSSSGGGVRYDDLFSGRGRWYLEHLVAARRVIDPAVALSLRD